MKPTTLYVKTHKRDELGVNLPKNYAIKSDSDLDELYNRIKSI